MGLCVEDLYVCLFMLCIFLYTNGPCMLDALRYPSQFRLHVQSLLELLKNPNSLALYSFHAV